MPSVVLARNPANVAVALVVVLGSRTAGTSATQGSIIHGLRASRRAKVSVEEVEVE